MMIALVVSSLVGCSDGSPTQPDDPISIEAQIKALFPPGASSQDAALGQIADIRQQIAVSATVQARSKALILVDFTITSFREGKLVGGTSVIAGNAASRLVNSLFQLVGMDPPNLPDGSLSGDGAARVVGPEGALIVTPSGAAGAQIPAGAIAQSVLVTITRLPTPPAPGTGPLPTTLKQYPPYYELATYPTVPQFGDSVRVGLCQVSDPSSPFYAPEAIHDRLRLAHAVGTSVEILERVGVNDFLRCDGTTAGISYIAASHGWLTVIGSVARKMLHRLAPAKLYAAHGGLGGKVKSFSPFAAVDAEGAGVPAAIVIATPPASTWVGSALTTAPIVEVRDRLGNLVQSPVTVYATVDPASGAVISGDTAIVAQKGVARFDNLGVAGTSSTVVLVFLATDVPPASVSMSLRMFAPGAPFRFDFTGPEESVIDVGQFGMFHTPDGAMSFRWGVGELNLWFPCGVSTCYLHGPTPTQLGPLQVGSTIAPTVFGRSGISSDFDGDYAAITSVLPAANGRDLIGIYHAEQQPCGGAFPFLRSFGIARSSDGGHTWARKGQIASSAETRPAAGDCSFGVYGPGDPAVTLSFDGTYWLAYFNDRVPNRRDEVYVARSPVESDGAPGTWMRYSAGSFSSPLLGGRGDPVIHPAAPLATTIYSAVGSVSWNVFLRSYIAFFQSMDGFYYATSTDGINWSAAQLLLGGPSWNDPNISPDTPTIAYPSFMSFDQNSQTRTSRTGYLYYARATKRMSPPHHMVRRRFEITPLP